MGKTNKDKMRFILASASPRRKELLSQVGIDFEVMVSDVEEVVKSTNPMTVVESLSYQKAGDIFAKTTGDVVVIGADTIVVVKGKKLGKPVDAEDAKRMLQMISGSSHSVFTGVTLWIRKGDTEKSITFCEETKVFVDEMSDDDIMSYMSQKELVRKSNGMMGVMKDKFEWSDKAGAYAVQGAFAQYITGISGDYNSVVGLPVGKLCQVLRKNNISYN